MPKNNQYDGLNYQEKKYSPMDLIIQGYAERGNSQANTDPASDSLKALKEQFQRDPNSLNPMQLLTLGSYEYSIKNQEQSEQQQRKANEFDKDKEAELEAVKQEMEAAQAKYQKLIGGDE
ncbi:hypothetical protein JMM81_20740 [Bacillus sp. V3B]|uniref:hypothetical protein n=1 Tax=Bacillus sp. V3B TaxID=2804915 RepID=UPI00210A2265|nr:hypothetical protein [Bacillus sp. V3B]MCQ6277304.1 hypothetical protein [Bacillus sp. V3B]